MDAETAWEKHSAGIKRFIASRLEDKCVVEDILHDVYLKSEEKFEQLRDVNKYTSWILKIAQNAVTDHYRRRLEAHSLCEEPEALDEACDANEWEKISRCVKPFIEQLPHKYREALMLSAIEGHDDKEVAKRMGISLSATKSRIARGKKMLKEKFDVCCIFNINSRCAEIESDIFDNETCEDTNSDDPSPGCAD